ncbi:hypothetical protein B5F29_14195 [Lachnoclostridium sp. An196]|uniref:hypothetical protein n=1 Tax=Lachnoclostridium sp. An196 TaxID=1965583 RepID=UPI000B384EDC|nr:hypothetical protein [Lachnoclostridium sp. An196]OUP16714.1 hypothetical protein B5F29_14195 [Lachnoclostridium sp. An196]
MDSRKKQSSFSSIGITSLVLIFVMLCLLTFSVLSLVTARADLRLSQKNAERTSAYYDAENRANDVLLSVISCIEEYKDSPDASVFYQKLRERLDGQNGILFTGADSLEYEVLLDKEQLLSVSLEISYETYDDGSHYRILAWNTVSTHEWESDGSLPLLDKEAVSDMLTEEE